MIRRLYPLGSPGHLLGTDELGRDMFARLIYGGRLSLFMGVTPVVCALADRRPARHHGGLPGRPRQHGDHARHGRVLRLPVRAAGDLAVGRHGRGRREHAAGAHPGLHPADLPRLGKRDHPGARLRFRRCRAGQRRQRVHHRARACAGQRAGADPGLRHLADQRGDHPGCRPLASSAWASSRPSRNGA